MSVFLLMAGLSCSYSFMQVPMAQVLIAYEADGQPASSAQITMQGQTHSEPVTREALAPGEALHVWLSKAVPENAIEMVVYQNAKPEGQSKLVNHNMPMGQEMWGNCVQTP